MTTDDSPSDRALAARLEALPTLAPRLPASAVVARARARTRRNRLVAGAALAAVALTAALVTPRDELRARGVDLAPAVVLEAVADGPAGPRPIMGPLGAEDRVVFRVRTAGAGVLTVDVDGARVWPTDGAWQVEAGTTWVGGDRPLAWTPDGPRSTHEATATLCPSVDAPSSACTSSSVVLRWP